MKNSCTLHLHRIYGTQGTNGTIRYQGAIICHTIELPWRKNRQRISCIPEGRYRLIKQRYHRHGEQIGISRVLNREAILFHAANDAQKELHGCIAPVMILTGAGQGIESRKALAQLKALVYSLWNANREVWLDIKEAL